MALYDFGQSVNGFGERGEASSGLGSPRQQLLYFCGLAISTDSPRYPVEGSYSWDVAKRKLIDLTKPLMKMNIQRAFDNIKKDKSAEYARLCAYGDFYEEPQIYHPENMKDYLRKTYGSLSDVFDQELGFNIFDALNFFDFIQNHEESSLEQWVSSMKRAAGKMVESIHAAFATAQDKRNIDRFHVISLLTIQNRFKDKTKFLLDSFAITREARESFLYTEENPFSSKPLIWLSPKDIFVPYSEFLLDAISSLFKKVVLTNTKWRRRADENFEIAVVKVLAGALPADIKTFSNCLEVSEKREHDFVVSSKRFLLACEFKNSKRRRPNLVSENGGAFAIEDFNSDANVGGAYSQAMSLVRLWNQKGVVRLIDEGGKEVEISKEDRVCLPVIITFERFGSLQVNCQGILVKQDENDPFPWSLCYCDLLDLGDMFSYFHKNGEDFLDYISWRVRNYRSIVSEDELAVVQAWLQGGTADISSDKTIVYSGSDLCDKIYFSKK